MLLSIVVPFFNSMEKCLRLLETLSALKDEAVELVFVDDGSTDGTASVLKEFSGSAFLKTKILFQSNKGPGSARNAGFDVAEGEYVWFVDSDDNVNPEVVLEVKRLAGEGFDFIDFDYITGGVRENSMRVAEGGYSVQNMVGLGDFGRVCTKVFRRAFLRDNDVRYPEFCIYEDNSLSLFVPLLVESFYKSSLVGYFHYEDFSSVTRSGVGLRYFDRLKTAEYGVFCALRLSGGAEVPGLAERFLRLYLINTVRKLTARGRFSYWFVAIRVMRNYRAVAGRYGLKLNPFYYFHGSFRRKMVFFLLWCLSYGFSDQGEYFLELNRKAWGLSKS